MFVVLLFPFIFTLFVLMGVILLVKNLIRGDLAPVIIANKKNLEMTIVLVLVMTSLFLILVYRNSIGIGYCINLIIFIILLGYWGKKVFDTFSMKKYILMMIPIIIIGCSVLFIDNQFMWFNVIVLIPTLFVLTILIMENSSFLWNIKNIIARFIVVILDLVYIPVRTFIPMRYLFKRDGNAEKDKNFKSLLIGVLVSLPTIGIILVLLSEADDSFKLFINQLIPDLDEKFLEYVMIFIIFGLSLFYSLFSFLIRQKTKSEPKILMSVNKKIKLIYFLPTIIAINVLYFIFIVLQSTYLFGQLPNGVTFSGYARRGFFELLTVALINLLILALFRRFTDIKTLKQKNIYRGLSTLICIFTLVLLISSATKMLLYIDNYDLTLMRVNVLFFIVYLFIFFILFMIKIWFEKIYFNKTIILYSICFYTLYSTVDAYSLVLDVNYKKYKQTGKIDEYYIKKLAKNSYKAKEMLKDLDIKIHNYEKRELEKPEKIKWQEFTFKKF